MSLYFANSFIFLLLNSGPLSESWRLAFSYVSYMLANAGITLSALVERTNFRNENLDVKCCTATVCLDDDIGPKRSTAFSSQHFLSTFQAFFYRRQCFLGFLVGKFIAGFKFFNKCFDFFVHTMKNKLFLNLLFNPLWSRCAPLCASSMDFWCSVSGRTIHSLFKTNPLPLTQSSLNIWLNSLASIPIIDMSPLVTVAAIFLKIFSSLFFLRNSFAFFLLLPWASIAPKSNYMCTSK